MKSLIYTNPDTNENYWCVSNIICNLTIEQYIQIVDLGFKQDKSYKPENFQWVEQPEGVSMATHEYIDGVFLELPLESTVDTEVNNQTPSADIVLDGGIVSVIPESESEVIELPSV